MLFRSIASDRPLTRAQLEEVNDLSSHIDASSTHALIEYHWGDFKYNPIEVLRDYFDGFLYWANWGSPQLAFRFPRSILPPTLLDGYDLDDFVTFTRLADYDILDIHFGEMESPDEWTEYELGSLMPIRDELMNDDLRSLYIVWLASQIMMEGYYDEDEDDEDEEDDEEEVRVPPVPPGFGTLTEAQQALAELLQVPQELLVAAGRHGNAAAPTIEDDVAERVSLLPPERRDEYLLRLARNEPGLSHILINELRVLSKDRETPTLPTGECVNYATLLTESRAVKAQLERERRQQEQLAHQRHLQNVHDHRDDYWRQAEQAVARGTGTGYDEADRLLNELRNAADYFNEMQEFQAHFRAWVRPHLRRPAFIKRLQSHSFSVPEA